MAVSALGHRSNKESGFTLIEMIFVLVILGIVSVFGGRFILKTLEIYQLSQQRTLMALQAATVLEQLTREIRGAAPTSVQVSDDGLCVAFSPALTAVRPVSVASGDGSQTADSIDIITHGFTLASDARMIWIEASTMSLSVNQAAMGIWLNPVDLNRGSHDQIRIENPPQWLHSASLSRVFITGDPVRYCFRDNALYRFSANTGWDEILLSQIPLEQQQLVAENLLTGDPSFSLDKEGEFGTRAVLVDITFNRRTLSFDIHHKVSLLNAL